MCVDSVLGEGTGNGYGLGEGAGSVCGVQGVCVDGVEGAGRECV